MKTNITLYRPTGANELELIIDSGMKRYPPRLYWQPIFYPVLNFQYAAEIAERWNMVNEDSDGVGFVTALRNTRGVFQVVSGSNRRTRASPGVMGSGHPT